MRPHPRRARRASRPGLRPLRLWTAVLLAGVLAAPAAAISPPKDPYFVSKGTWGQSWDDMWAIKRAGFTGDKDSAWHKVKDDASPIVVAVIDTGLDWHHKDISWNNLWQNPGEVPENGVDDDENGYVDDIIGWNFYANDNKPWDHDGHGTFTAGMLGGTWNNGAGIAGINPKIQIMVLKGLNNFGHSRASYLAHALVYAADNGARVINMSVGGPGTTQIERDAVDYAWSKGAVVVVAAGNKAIDTVDYGLATHPKVLSVAATDMDDKRAKFSNWGAAVDLAAPGMDVLSLRARRTDLMRDIEDVKYTPGDAYVGDDKRYYRTSGTSFAAPIVAGVASLILANDPKLSNQQVVRMLKNSARDAELPGVDQYTGYGIVDAAAALSISPDFYLTSSIRDVAVETRGGSSVVKVLGTADADHFATAWLELGPGAEPTQWKKVGEPVGAAVKDGELGEIHAREFAGAPLWQIKLVTQHEDGTTREARFELDLE